MGPAILHHWDRRSLPLAGALPASRDERVRQGRDGCFGIRHSHRGTEAEPASATEGPYATGSFTVPLGALFFPPAVKCR